MRNLTLFFAIILIPMTIGYSQPIDTLWTKTISYPGSSVLAYELVKYSPDEFIVTGGFGDSLFIVKITSKGSIIWEKYLYETGGLYGAAIDKDAIGNFYVIVWGLYLSNQWYLMKFNELGDSLWSYTFSDPGSAFHIPYAITISSDYVYVAASAGNGPDNFALHKFNFDGDLLYSRIYPTGVNFSIPRSITHDSNGNVILVGTGGTFWGWYILKCNSNGDTLWSKSLNGGEARNVITDNNDNVIATGWTNKILKYDPDGNLLFSQTLGGDDNWEGASLLKYDDENVFVIGAKRRGIGSWAFDILLGKYSINNGDPIWTYVYYYPEPEAGAYGWDGAVFFDSSLIVLSTAYTVVSGNYYHILYLMSFSLEDTPVSVLVDVKGPLTFDLKQNYPNPFNPSTIISYQLPERSQVTLKVYDVLGKEVANLVNGTMEAGSHEVQFSSAGLSSGIYFYRLETNGIYGSSRFVDVKKMTVLK